MIEPEKKNKAILAYTTKTRRGYFHKQRERLGFASTSKMILQALEFLIKTLNNGITMNKIRSIDSKDPVWNNYNQKTMIQKKDVAEVKEKLIKSPKGDVIREIKGIFKDGGFKFIKHSNKDLGIKDEVIDHRIKEKYRGLPS